MVPLVLYRLDDDSQHLPFHRRFRAVHSGGIHLEPSVDRPEGVLPQSHRGGLYRLW